MSGVSYRHRYRHRRRLQPFWFGHFCYTYETNATARFSSFDRFLRHFRLARVPARIPQSQQLRSGHARVRTVGFFHRVGRQQRIVVLPRTRQHIAAAHGVATEQCNFQEGFFRLSTTFFHATARRTFLTGPASVPPKMFINDYPFMESMPSNNNFVLKTEPYVGEGATYNGNVWISGNRPLRYLTITGKMANRYFRQVRNDLWPYFS